MSIPKKQLNLVVELMSALPLDGSKYDYHVDVEYLPHDEVYLGYFDTAILDKMQSIGVIQIIGLHDDERQELKLIERDDFLSSFAAGVNEARNGNDMLYADYNNNQYAFTCGYQHYQARAKKPRIPQYTSDNEYVCHGFVDAATSEIWKQA